jgi:PBSX family phage terminase large subunit
MNNGFMFGRFSPKAEASILMSTRRINIWEGSVRSGKTISSIVRWLEYIKTAPPGDLLMCGKTERTLKRNILDVIESIVTPRYYRYNRGTGEVTLYGRRIYVAGANDERSEGKIRGLTLSGAYCDEITLFPESFFKMLLSRLSVKRAMLFGTTNPDGPYHWLKTDYIDNDKINKTVWHFTLEDNPNLDPAYVAALKNEYTGLWYKRYIDGLWVLAEGVIYDMFDESVHVIRDKALQQEIIENATDYYISMDYGTGTVCVFGLFCFYKGKRYLIKSQYYDARVAGRQKSDSDYAQDLLQFSGDKQVKAIIIPNDALSFIAECRKQRIGPIRVYERKPGTVLRGIRNHANLISTGQYFIFDDPSNKEVIKEYSAYVWDPKAAERGEDVPLKQYDHGKDMERYYTDLIPAPACNYKQARYKPISSITNY